MELIWEYTFTDELGVNPKGKRIMHTEPPSNPRKNREKMAEITFEKFGASHFFVQIQAVLALYSSGRPTGLVLDSGDGVSHTVPVFEGYTLQPSVKRANVAGHLITNKLQHLLQSANQDRTIDFLNNANFETVRMFKESNI